MNQILESQQTPHSLPVSIVTGILEENHRVIIASHCSSSQGLGKIGATRCICVDVACPFRVCRGFMGPELCLNCASRCPSPSTSHRQACMCVYRPFTRYVKLRVAHAPGMPGTFPRHHGLAMPTCITARASRTRLDECRDRYLGVSIEVGGMENVPAHTQFYASDQRPVLVVGVSCALFMQMTEHRIEIPLAGQTVNNNIYVYNL